LLKAFSDIWNPSALKIHKDVIQLDLANDDILSNAELDAFGYMFTLEGKSLTRKSAVGIIKAVSLYDYDQDMAFYSNHGLVKRANAKGYEAHPNPFSKEEHLSLYKLSFTIDGKWFGMDRWIVDNVNFFDEYLTIEFEKNLIKTIKAKMIVDEEKFKKYENENENGLILINKLNDKVYEIIFQLKLEKKKERVISILEALKSGLYSQTSGEANTLVLLFMLASGVKVPSPIFHSYLEVKRNYDSFDIIGLKDCVKNIWIDKNDKIFLYKSEKMKSNFSEKITEDWNEFLNNIGLN